MSTLTGFFVLALVLTTPLHADEGKHLFGNQRDEGPPLTKAQLAFVEALQNHTRVNTFATPAAEKEKVKQEVTANVTGSPLTTKERLELTIRYLSTKQRGDIVDANKFPLKQLLLPNMSVLLGGGHFGEAAAFLGDKLDSQKAKPAEYDATLSMLRALHRDLRVAPRNDKDALVAIALLKFNYRKRLLFDLNPGKEEEWAKSHEFLRPLTFIKLSRDIGDEDLIKTAQKYADAYDKHYGINEPKTGFEAYREAVKILYAQK